MISITKNWSLFLDRDGVINHDTPNDYVRNADLLRLFDTSVPALKILNGYFKNIVVVTNQRGVGRGIMSLADLNGIHAKMLEEVTKGEGRIDHFFFCTDVESEGSTHRKPAPGMAYDAQQLFPTIQFDQSIMVGNNISDMLFGRAVGMTTVYIDDRKERNGIKSPEMDYLFDDLLAFAQAIRIENN